MDKFLIICMYVLQVVIGAALKSAELVSLSWVSIFAYPTVISIIYLLLYEIASGQLVFGISKFLRKHKLI